MALDGPIRTQGLHRPRGSHAKKWFVHATEIEKAPMLGLMQQQSLLISSLIEFADRHHGDGEVVSRRVEGDVHRYSWSDVANRSRQVANTLELAARGGCCTP